MKQNKGKWEHHCSPFPCLSVRAEGSQPSREGPLISNFAQSKADAELLEHSLGFFAWRQGPWDANQLEPRVIE